MRVLRVFERDDSMVRSGTEKFELTLHETLEGATTAVSADRLSLYQFYNLDPISITGVSSAAARRLREEHERATSIVDGELAKLERRPVVLDAEARIPLDTPVDDNGVPL